MDNLDISGLDKAAVLAALYNAARPQGRGFLHYDPAPMETEEAREILRGGSSFDYLRGRVLKVNISADSFDPRLFDRDNGEGAAYMAIQSLRSGDQPDNATTARIHEHGTINSAHELMEQLQERPKSDD